jgi:hypothetical protein
MSRIEPIPARPISVDRVEPVEPPALLTPAERELARRRREEERERRRRRASAPPEPPADDDGHAHIDVRA